MEGKIEIFKKFKGLIFQIENIVFVLRLKFRGVYNFFPNNNKMLT
jgi:hypothetical protein